MPKTNKKQVIVYVSEEEKELLSNKAKENNLPLTQYMVKAALSDKEIVINKNSKEKPIIKIETDDLFGVLGEIKELREKFNQASNSIIKTGAAYPRELEEMEKSLNNIETIITEKTYTILENRKKIKTIAKELIDKKE
mgnify:CR=1 FL=1